MVCPYSSNPIALLSIISWCQRVGRGRKQIRPLSERMVRVLSRRYTIHSTMKDIETKLGTDQFIRVHRSFIVRLDKIASIDFPNLQLENDRKLIPIGGSYRDELTNRIKML